MPDGTKVMAEVMSHQTDMVRGMMFRDELPQGRGMMFVHGKPGQYPYFLYQVKIPLDILWMDARGRVVEFVENAPPCKTNAQQCPQYGGKQQAVVVLELPAGYARKHGVELGEIVRF
jgi:uncharacterized protein